MTAAELRVLHVIHSISPVTGGPAAALGMFVDASRTAGVNGSVLTTDGMGTAVHPWVEGASVTMTRALGPRRVGLSPQMLMTMRREAAKYDIIHVHGMWMFHSIAAALVSAAHRVPLVIRPCGSLTRGATGRAQLAKSLYFKLLETHVVRAASLFQFATNWERDESRDLAGSIPGAVIPVPVSCGELPDRNSARSRLGLSESGPVVLSVGRIHDIKRLDLLVRALSLLPDTRLALVGPDGGAGVGLRELAGSLGVLDRILFCGLADTVVIADWMAAADLFASSSSHENFGLAIAEACAAAMPCVIPEHLGISRELEGAVVCVKDEPHAIASQWRRLLDDEVARRSLGSRARARAAELWSKESVGRALRVAYESILRVQA